MPHWSIRASRSLPPPWRKPSQAAWSSQIRSRAPMIKAAAALDSRLASGDQQLPMPLAHFGELR